MQKITVRCGSDTVNKKVCRFLRENGFQPRSASEEENGSILALFVSLPKGSWEEKARALANGGTAVIAIVSPEEAASAERELSGVGGAVLCRPVRPSELLQALRICARVGCRLRALGDENERLKATIGELKLIDRAKCALVGYLGMTEKDAHRFLEKQAMDRRLPRREVALEILKAYET